MKPIDLARIRAGLDPPWDDLREQRVLARVVHQRRAEPARSRRRRAIAMSAAGGVLAAAAALFLLGPARGIFKASPAPTAVVASSAGESTMALADGSQAVLLREANVQVEEQRSDRVRIAQSRGAVRYEVRPDPAREFAVRAAGVTVRVRGTVFTVDLSGDTVEVHVQRGRVEVDDGTRKRDLGAGEALRVPAQRGPDPLPLSAVPPDRSSAPPPPEPTESIDPAPAPSVLAPPSASALQAAADSARVAGHNAEAAAALEKLVALHPSDPRVPGALFTLGRIERARGHYGASAHAFERCQGVAPGGPLAQDAVAEAAVSWSAAGAGEAARADASKYLLRWPNGPNAGRMRSLLAP
jgi:transmembrane sensor